MRALTITMAALTVSIAAPVAGQSDPSALQTRGTAMMTAARTNALRTGERNDDAVRAAVTVLEQSESALLEAGRPGDAALSAIQIGSCHRLLLDAEGAKRSYERGVMLAKRGRKLDYVAKALRGLALVEMEQLKQYANAQAHLEEGLKIAETLPDQGYLFDLLDAHAEYQGTMHDYAASIRGYTDLLNRLTPLNDSERLVYAYQGRHNSYFELAHSCSNTSQHLSACLAALERAVADAASSAEHADRLGWTFMATNMRNQEDLAALELKNLRVAVDIQAARRLPNPGFDPTVVERIQEVKRDWDALDARTTDAVRAWTVPDPATDRAVATASQAVDAGLRALARDNEAMKSVAAAAAGASVVPFMNPRRPEDVMPMSIAPPADRDLNLVVSAMMAWVNAHPNARARAAFAAAQAATARGDHPGALTQYSTLLRELEQDRSAIGDVRQQNLFMQGRSAIYSAVARNLLEDGRRDEAFDLIERNRGRSLTDMLGNRRPGARNAAEQRLFAELHRADAEIQEVERASLVNGNNAARDQRWQQLSSERQRLADQLRRESPRLFDLHQSPSVTLDQVRRVAAADQRDILQYLVHDAGIVIWHIGPHSDKARAVLLSRETLRGKLARLQAVTVDTHATFDQTLARELYLFLIEPMRAELSTPRLTIIADDELSALPFNLLEDPARGTVLGEEYQLSSVSSAGMLVHLKAPASIGNGRILSVVSSEISSEDNADITASTGARVTTLRDPSKQALFDAIAGYSAVHIAAHGEFYAQAPMLATVKLSKAGDALTAAEAFALPLAGTKLVTLGSCEVGSTPIVGSDEMYGMVRAFLFAGAEGVVAASWKVRTNSASLYFQTFYTEVRQAPPAEAARRALSAVRAQYPHPFDWAPFRYTGR